MNVLTTDLSGKVIRYDHALFAELHAQCAKEDSFGALCPQESLFTANVYKKIRFSNITPSYMNDSAGWRNIRRAVKFCEGLLNYFHIYRYIRDNRVDVLHLEWLPYLDFCSVEKHILMFLKKHFPCLRIILTVHNIYPHNFSAHKREKYRRRMEVVQPYINHYIVHNQFSKEAICQEFNINQKNVTVIHHGVFPMEVHTNVQFDEPNRKKRLLMFGFQSFYKGTDLVIEAVKLLPKDYLNKIDISIMGISDKELYEKYQEDCKLLGIYWKNGYVDDSVLSMAIYQADALLYPYRSISQSGALLQGIYARKPIILSKLPAFVETMIDYPEELFCNVNDPIDLSKVIKLFVDGAYDSLRMEDSLQKLNLCYSWASAARKNWALYRKVYAN